MHSDTVQPGKEAVLTGYSRHKPQKRYVSEDGRTQKDEHGTIRFTPGIVPLTGTEGGLTAARGCETAGDACVSHGDRVSSGDDGCTAVGMYLMPPITLK